MSIKKIDELKEDLLFALETLNDTAYYEDGYSELDRECYLVLREWIMGFIVSSH